jgi:hypothetical protein
MGACLRQKIELVKKKKTGGAKLRRRIIVAFVFWIIFSSFGGFLGGAVWDLFRWIWESLCM